MTPLDQSQGILRLQIWEEYGDTEFKLFLRSMRLFAQYATSIGFIRYEDFVRDHDKELGKSCNILAIPFDRTYRENWQHYENISGNVSGSYGGISQIQALPQRHLPKDKLDDLLTNSDYRTTCYLFGYTAAF